MPRVIECPGCGWKGRVPDTAIGKRLRCPSCKYQFTAEAPASPAPPEDVLEIVEDTAGENEPSDYETVEDEEEDDRPRKKRHEREDEEAEDRPRNKRREPDDEDDEDEDNRPRKKRREPDDDEEDEDRPRKKRGGREDEEDDDDRPRKKRRKREDDEDEEEDQPRKKSKKSRGLEVMRLRTSVFLNFIAAGLYIGALGVWILLWLIAWLAGRMPYDLYAIPALIGLGNLVVALIGFGYGLAGPTGNGARGLGIATISVAGAHLLFALVGLGVSSGPFGPAVRWECLVTNLEALPALFLVFRSVLLVPVFASLLELARMILYALTLRAQALTLNKHDLAARTKVLVIGLGVISGALLVVTLILGIVGRNVSSFSALRAVAMIITLTTFVGVLAMVIWYMLVVKLAREEFGA